MEWEKKNNQEKHQFKSYYCRGCWQRKPCRLLTSENRDWHGYCCPCYFQREAKRAEEYTDYQQVYQQEKKEQQVRIQQLKRLREYMGCKHCGSKEVDAYDLYENNKLVCQPCLKEGGSASPISFYGRSQWYKKRWGINLGEWLDTYDYLPINANCAKKWLKNKQHLSNCACLEQGAKETYELFANSWREMEEKLKKCTCKISKKVRISSDYYAWCEICEETITVASKKRVIKNRNDPKFWGLEVKEKVLCRDCLEARKGEMTPLRRAKFNEYKKLGRL